MSSIALIAALGTRTRAIGKDGGLLWHLPGDLPRFKTLTLGNPVIMGVRTFMSIGTPLPDRTNIVLTYEPTWTHPGVTVCHSIPEALTIAQSLSSGEIFIIGGGSVYEQTIEYADRLYLTLVEDDTEGDTFFPEYAHLPFVETTRIPQEANGMRFAWVTYKRMPHTTPSANKKE